MSLFQSLREYELFVYSLADQFPRILRSTLVVVQRGRYFAEFTGEVLFPDGYRLNITSTSHLTSSITASLRPV